MAEEIGRVNDQLEAYVMVSLTSGGTIECLIDTGFSGALMLPRSFVEQNNLPLTGQENMDGVVAAETSPADVLLKIFKTPFKAVRKIFR